MPKREGGDALRPPLSAASRMRPGSSNAASTARPGPYALGGTFANSSSSLISSRGNAMSDPNLVTTSTSGPVAATEAPHLSASEAFFGRMTLTAPDNMRRKKAEEKEKKKQSRKRRAEKGAIAAATLINPQEAGPSTALLSRTLVTASSTAAADASTRRKRSHLPTSNSTLNLHSHTIEQSRSRSPSRPSRPQSAQTRHVESRQVSPERRRLRERERTGSGSSVVEHPSRPHSASAIAPAYQNETETQQNLSENDAEVVLQSTAAQRRRDIYADLDSLGLPGASESDLEDQPPPFPLNPTRPISPPRMPAEGEEWSEDLRRLQEEYEMNRPPDSPPPAFRSDDEGRRGGEDSADNSFSDEEDMSVEIQRERREWEEDKAAGFSLEERVERDQRRREARDLQAKEDANSEFMDALRPAVENAEVDEALRQELEQPDGIRLKETQEQAMLKSPHEVDLFTEDVESAATTAQEIEVVPITDPEGLVQQEQTEEELAEPLNLGQLVMEARARRGVGKQSQSAKAAESLLNNTIAEANTELANGLSSPPILSTSQTTSVQTVLASHRRVASDGTLLPMKSAATARAAAQAKKRNAVGTGPGLRDGEKSLKEKERQAKATKIRSRPSGGAHSRFRDGASAAANRRMELWGPLAASGSDVVVKSSLPRAETASEVKIVTSSLESPPLLTRPSALRQASSSSTNTPVSAHEGDVEGSSDSDDKWDKEEKAFEKMQRRLAPVNIDDESSEEEANKTSKDDPHPPGWFRHTSIDLAKPGSSVPRAPPPLVLGRSRGGAEYSSSSSSSSDSGAGRMEDDSDDGSLSPVEVEEPILEARSSSDMHSRLSVKGKQPIRPSFVEGGRSTSAPLPPIRPITIPAGDFEEDSGSSHDFLTDDEEQPPRQERRTSDDSVKRPPVNNRLKELFSTPLNSSQAGPSAASRASLERFFDTQLDSSRQPPRPTSTSSRRSSQGIVENNEEGQSLSKQPSNISLRSRERANAYASLESKARNMTSEQHARLEALEQISRLQQMGPSSSSTTSSVNQDSLDALERLLSRRSVAPSFTKTQAAGDGPLKLTRAGAINRRESTAPFVNPRSSIAPRPLGRLPTITNATRHFPPSSQSSMSNAGDKSDSSTSTTLPFPPPNQTRRSGIGTPSWMAYIPYNERRNLPEPLEPVKKRLDGLSTNTSNNRAPPPLPLPQSGNRVSAMIERFEVQASDANIPPISPRSPSKDNFGSPLLTTTSSEESNREHTLRRRPPPPPPPSTWSRHSTLPPIDAPLHSSPPAQINPTQDGTSSQQQELTKISTLSHAFLPDNIAGPSRSSSEQSILDSPFLPQRTSLESGLNQESVSMESSAPRIRRRPLPIPPIFAPSNVRPNVESTVEQPVDFESTEISALPTTVQAHQRENREANTEESLASTSQEDSTARAAARRAPSLGYTDLDLFASRLADEAPADGTNYEDLHLLAEFLGPAKSEGASSAEIEALSVGVVEVLRKRIVGKKENGKDKIKLALNVMGVKVERCGVCLIQFKEGNLACVFPCLHV